LNELLGAWESENNNTQTLLPKTEAKENGRATHTIPRNLK
jgi:hypothetical protein